MDSSPHSIALFLKMRGLVRQLAVMRLQSNRLDPIALRHGISPVLPVIYLSNQLFTRTRALLGELPH